MRLTIITPQGIRFDNEVERVQFPSTTGLMEVLTGHAPMIAELKPGTVVTDQGDVSVGNGVVRVEDNVVTVACE